MKKFFLATLAVCFLALTSVALAAGPLGGALENLNKAVGPSSGTGLSDDLAGTIGLIIKGVLSLVGTIFFVLTIYAGILWMTAQGEEEKVTKAQDILKAAIIGLIITLGAYAITVFVTGRLGDAGQGPAGQVTPTGQVTPAGPAPEDFTAKCSDKAVLAGGSNPRCRNTVSECQPGDATEQLGGNCAVCCYSP